MLADFFKKDAVVYPSGEEARKGKSSKYSKTLHNLKLGVATLVVAASLTSCHPTAENTTVVEPVKTEAKGNFHSQLETQEKTQEEVNAIAERLKATTANKGFWNFTSEQLIKADNLPESVKENIRGEFDAKLLNHIDSLQNKGSNTSAALERAFYLMQKEASKTMPSRDNKKSPEETILALHMRARRDQAGPTRKNGKVRVTDWRDDFREELRKDVRAHQSSKQEQSQKQTTQSAGRTISFASAQAASQKIVR